MEETRRKLIDHDNHFTQELEFQATFPRAASERRPYVASGGLTTHCGSDAVLSGQEVGGGLKGPSFDRSHYSNALALTRAIK